MSRAGASETFNLTLMINKERTKVLFASVDSDFADVLLSFLALPLGVILKILADHCGEQAPKIGSLNTLYDGLQNLDSVYFCTETGKQMLLNPRSSLEDKFSKLKLNIYGTRPRKYSTCICSVGSSIISLYHDSAICTCGKSRTELRMIDIDSGCNGEVFINKKVSFLVSDDLCMLSNMTGSIIQSLQSWGITDVSGAVLETVTVGLKEIMDLLELSLLSQTPLSDLFLKKRRIHNTTTAEHFLNQVKQEENCSSAKTMKITAMVHKSNHKVLFAQAEKDFIEFLFSLLTIPLGQVESLLGMNSSLGSIDNLYRSLASFNWEKCLRTENTKTTLLVPKHPPKYLSKHQIFSLTEQGIPHLHIHKNDVSGSFRLSSSSNVTDFRYYATATFVDPKGQGSYVNNGNGMFMVTDDLTVTPLFMHSSLSTLTELSIPLFDIEEHEVDIGLDEALNILKASLTSTSALTNGLKLKAASIKQPKRERS